MNSGILDWLLVFGLTAPPLYTGLPDRLPPSFPQDGFVSYSPVRGDRHQTPLGTQIVINGEKARWSDAGKIDEIFFQEHLALLPEGRTIRELEGDGLEKWDYPIGTRVLHRIVLRTEPPRDFELRMIEKLADGRWAYGLYAFDGSFELKKYAGFEPVRIETRLATGKQVEVSMSRINLSSCLPCHQAQALDWHQYEAGNAGPCGFSPSNPELKSDWASRYREKHGLSPFAR